MGAPVEMGTPAEISAMPHASTCGPTGKFSTQAEERRSLELFVLLFFAAFLSAVLYVVYGPGSEYSRGGEEMTLALNLARNGAFANPYQVLLNTGASAHSAPVYPLLAAALIRLFHDHAYAILGILTILLQALNAALLPSLSRLLFGSARPGIYGAALAILFPVYWLHPAWDTMLTTTGLLVFCIWTERVIRRQSHVVRNGALAGLGGALLLLTNPASLLVFAPWVVFALFRRDTSPAFRVRFCSTFAAGLLLGCLPWSVRNYRELHAVVPIRDDLGLELYAGNNDCAEPSLAAMRMKGCTLHPIANMAEAQLVRKMGEVPYNRSRMSLAVHWIQAHPARFLSLSLHRIREFWFPTHELPVWLVSVLCLPGLVLLGAKRLTARWFLYAALLLYPLIYYVVASDVRYVYPVLWVSQLSAGYFLMMAVHRFASVGPLFRQAVPSHERQPGETEGES